MRPIDESLRQVLTGQAPTAQSHSGFGDRRPKTVTSARTVISQAGAFLPHIGLWGTLTGAHAHLPRCSARSPLALIPAHPGLAARPAMDDGSPKGSGSLLRRPSSNQLPKEISQTKSVRKLMAPPQALRESAGPFPPALLRPEDSNPLEQHAPSVAFLDLSVGGGAPSLAVALERLRVVVTRGAKVEAVSFAGT